MGLPAGGAPAQRAAPPREGEKPEPGGIFRLGDAGLPIALAEGQQDGGIGDSLAVVGEGNAGAIAILLDGCGNLTPSSGNWPDERDEEDQAERPMCLVD